MTSFFKKIINRLIGSAGSDQDELNNISTLPAAAGVATAPLTEQELAAITRKRHQVDPQQLIVGVGRHIGRQREVNEDALYAHTTILDANNISLPFGIYVMADGMGGHKNGEVASEYAARTMGTYLVEQFNKSLFGPDPKAPEESIQEILRQGMDMANGSINEHAPDGGTTMTAAVVIGSQVTIAHVGDSRAYAVYLDGRIQTLTRDHSLAKRLEELGQITAEEAANHPQKSMLYNALGQGDLPRPDVFTATFPHPGYLFLCTDGLWGVIPDDELFSIITSAPSLQLASQNLIEAANAAGGPDNISLILVRMSD